MGAWREGRQSKKKQKWRKEGERRTREQEDLVRGRIEENKKRDTITEGAIIGLRRGLALGRFPEIYKDDTN